MNGDFLPASEISELCFLLSCHSSIFRYMPAPAPRMPLVPQHSLPLVNIATKCCTLTDDFIIDRTHIITEKTYRGIQTLIEADMRSQAPGGPMYGVQQMPTQMQPSLGSLPSATSYSSISSFGSNASQRSGMNPIPPRYCCQNLLVHSHVHKLRCLVTEYYYCNVKEGCMTVGCVLSTTVGILVGYGSMQ